jgi:membrane protein YdbS with pleckstrin-like domain
MSYVDRHLLPGETVAFKTKTHWKVYVGPAVFSILVAIPLSIWALTSENKAIALLPLVLIPIAFVPAYFRRRSSEFAVTTKRVIAKVGVFQTRSVELLLGKVEGIAVNQGVGGKLFGYGEVVITGSGGTKEEFAGIQAPLDFRQAVQAATDASSGAGASR